MIDAEHRARVRDMRQTLVARHEQAQREVSAAEWNLRQLEQSLTRLRDNRDFMVRELEEFDKRHKEYL